MAYLLDTNIAVRSVLQSDPQYPLINAAVIRLVDRGESVVLSAQVLSEAWALFTRPSSARGGYGLTVSRADALMTDINTLAALIPEPPGLWAEHRRLLVSCQVSGIETYDCRIAAWCRLCGVDTILTLNGKDFKRYGVAAVGPGDI